MVLLVQAAHSLKSGSAAGKKIHYEGVFFGAGYFYEVFYKRDRFRVIKGVFFAKKVVQMGLGVTGAFYLINYVAGDYFLGVLVEYFYTGNCIVSRGRAKPDAFICKKLVHFFSGALPLAGPDFTRR